MLSFNPKWLKLRGMGFVKSSKMVRPNVDNDCLLQEGIGINEILNAIVQRIPPPPDSARKPLRALIFDRYYILQHLQLNV